MKIIEALKKLKSNEGKIADLRMKISQNTARLSYESSQYSDPAAQITEWVQSCRDTMKESERLSHLIHKTNLLTNVTIEIGGKKITKSIDEWIYRRVKGAPSDYSVFQCLTDRNLKETAIKQSDGTLLEVKIVRAYDAEQRDKALAIFREEPTLIDGALEIINATTDLLEE